MRQLLVFILCFCSYAQAQVVATVGDTKITAKELAERLNDFKAQTNSSLNPEQLLEEVIRFEVGLLEAEKAKLKEDPLVKSRIKQVLYNSLLEKQLGTKLDSLQVNEKEMKAYYKNNPEIQLAHILIEVKPGAKPEDRKAAHKRAEEVVAAAKSAKTPFDQLAKSYSDDEPTKDLGGDIGYQTKVTLAPIIYDKAVKMNPGEVNGPIETPFGFHIIKLIDRHSYDSADKRQLRSAVYEEKRTQLFNDYFEKAKKSYRIQINKDALKSLTQ